MVSSVTSVKYLYKYVYKGDDAANITIEENDNDRVINHDEIRCYIETRYISPVEACYRILSKPLQSKSHSIVRLSVHIPNQQSIVIDDISDDTTVSAALARTSTLLAFFELNARDQSAKQYTYAEMDVKCTNGLNENPTSIVLDVCMVKQSCNFRQHRPF